MESFLARTSEVGKAQTLRLGAQQLQGAVGIHSNHQHTNATSVAIAIYSYDIRSIATVTSSWRNLSCTLSYQATVTEVRRQPPHTNAETFSPSACSHPRFYKSGRYSFVPLETPGQFPDLDLQHRGVSNRHTPGCAHINHPWTTATLFQWLLLMTTIRLLSLK